MTPKIGHNNGPTMEPGYGFRLHAWRQSRRELLPHLPIEVVRGQLRRAKALGLDYRTYATVSATSGHDIVAFLFSSNALRLQRSAQDLPQDRAAKLRETAAAAQLVAAHRPIEPVQLAADMQAQHGIDLRAVCRAPLFTDSWSQTRDRLKGLLVNHKLTPAGVVLVGETSLERDWTAAGNFAAFLSAERYFSESPAP